MIIMKMILLTLKNAIKESGLLPSFKVREKLAVLYLRGEGLEIGALHLPLKTPENVKVRYVDIVTREENIRRFPELDASRIVTTDYLENGFELSGIPDVSQDFVIANHVLEHSGNPLKVLHNWGRVIKPQGIMMVTVPVADRCFDKGRSETPLEHFMEDYRLNEAGETAMFRERNKQHFAEWLRTAEPKVARLRGGKVSQPDEESFELRLEKMSKADGLDIHYHTFCLPSFKKLLDYFCADISKDFQVLEICSSRGGSEIVAIMKRR
jgi:SAM-dependent methyltransferase